MKSLLLIALGVSSTLAVPLPKLITRNETVSLSPGYLNNVCEQQPHFVQYMDDWKQDLSLMPLTDSKMVLPIRMVSAQLSNVLTLVPQGFQGIVAVWAMEIQLPGGTITLPSGMQLQLNAKRLVGKQTTIVAPQGKIAYNVQEPSTLIAFEQASVQPNTLFTPTIDPYAHWLMFYCARTKAGWDYNSNDEDGAFSLQLSKDLMDLTSVRPTNTYKDQPELDAIFTQSQLLINRLTMGDSRLTVPEYSTEFYQKRISDYFGMVGAIGSHQAIIANRKEGIAARSAQIRELIQKYELKQNVSDFIQQQSRDVLTQYQSLHDTLVLEQSQNIPALTTAALQFYQGIGEFITTQKKKGKQSGLLPEAEKNWKEMANGWSQVSQAFAGKNGIDFKNMFKGLGGIHNGIKGYERLLEALENIAKLVAFLNDFMLDLETSVTRAADELKDRFGTYVLTAEERDALAKKLNKFDRAKLAKEYAEYEVIEKSSATFIDICNKEPLKIRAGKSFKTALVNNAILGKKLTEVKIARATSMIEFTRGLLEGNLDTTMVEKMKNKSLELQDDLAKDSEVLMAATILDYQAKDRLWDYMAQLCRAEYFSSLTYCTPSPSSLSDPVSKFLTDANTLIERLDDATMDKGWKQPFKTIVRIRDQDVLDSLKTYGRAYISREYFLNHTMFLNVGSTCLQQTNVVLKGAGFTNGEGEITMNLSPGSSDTQRYSEAGQIKEVRFKSRQPIYEMTYYLASDGTPEVLTPGGMIDTQRKFFCPSAFKDMIIELPKARTGGFVVNDGLDLSKLVGIELELTGRSTLL